MNQQQRLPRAASTRIVDDTGTLSGIWLRWDVLTQAERFVCVSIVLIPLWWWIGWGYIPLLLLFSIISYELLNHGGLRLQRPSLTVVSVIAFGLYRLVGSNLSEIAVNSVLNPIAFWICGGLILWYIQSNDIRVRLQVVGWACSVSVAQMIVFWLVVHFVFSEPHYAPYRTLIASLTGKAEQFLPGAGNGNYLRPYEPYEKGLGGLARFSFFFSHPEVSSFVVSFTGLLALDLRNRFWSLLLLGACSFLLVICQTRSAWLSFPILLVVRWLFTTGKIWGPSIVCTLFAVASFVTLSLPPVTDALINTYTHTVEATGNFRQESTEGRAKIYERTLEDFWEAPFLGHGVNGPTVVPGYDPARIGSHSFILGTLLYKSGLLGTAIFLTFWTSFIVWLYNTRVGRSACCFLILIYFSLSSLVTEFEIVTLLLFLLCTIIREPKCSLLGSLSTSPTLSNRLRIKG